MQRGTGTSLSAAARLAALASTLVLVSLAAPANAAPVGSLPPITDPAPFGCLPATPGDTVGGRYLVCTNDPSSSDPAQREPYLEELTRLTELAVAGDQIHIAMYNWWYRKVDQPTYDYSEMYDFTHALIDAADRGVGVHIALDEHSDPDHYADIDVPGLAQPWDELSVAANVDFVSCGETTATDSLCLQTPGNDSAIQHNKLFLFRLGGTKHVLVSSANLGAPGMGDQYQNLVGIRDDVRLYDFFADYYRRLVDNDWDGWTTAADRRSNGDANPFTGVVETRGYVYPHPKPEDTVANILGKVQSCPSSGDRKIWLAEPSIKNSRLTANDNQLLDLLTSLVNLGCGVKIITKSVDDPADPDDVFSTLTSTGAEVVTVSCLHSKYIIVDAVSNGMNGGDPGSREYVWTGSSNLGPGSAWSSANSNVWVEQHDVVRAYVSNFTAIWNRNYAGEPDPSCT
ncbi:phospholipase D-like domain-containing protein [Jiangella asiatica]|nr:phospholipase D-like domain-containing protein [Jiangella asiatica]